MELKGSVNIIGECPDVSGQCNKHLSFQGWIFLHSFKQFLLAKDVDVWLVKALKDLRHDNLNSFVGACVEPGNVCIISDYCTRGSLRWCPHLLHCSV